MLLRHMLTPRVHMICDQIEDCDRPRGASGGGGGSAALEATTFPDGNDPVALNWLGQSFVDTFTATITNTGDAAATNVVATLSVFIQIDPAGDDSALVTVNNVAGSGWAVTPLGGNVFELTRATGAPGALPTIEFDVTLASGDHGTITVRTTIDVDADNTDPASHSWDATIQDVGGD